MLYWLFLIAVIVQCVYALYFFMRITTLPKKAKKGRSKKPVSVIICAHNEAENLRANLPAILEQNYQDRKGVKLYEVIVVNDTSDDKTAAVLQELEAQYEHLWDVIISKDAPRPLKGKKLALSKGVAAAKHELLLLTDADCRPASNEWLALMAAPLNDGKEIVAGYGGYERTLGWLNAFIRWETTHTFLQYSTYTLAGQPYMAVGRNLACTKSVLIKAQSDERWNKLPSGDDDMLVNIAGNKDNVTIVADKRAFTYSKAKDNVKDWIVQKQRHLSTGKYYNNGTQVLLGIYGISHAAMWLGLIGALATGHLQSALIILSARCLLYWILWGMTANRLNEKKLAYGFPLFDIGWMVYNFAFLPYITWKNKNRWT